ncbi:MAG: metal-dependent hydrolase [Thermoflexales bacterium]|nr:metal-dependent hydrolase [Thermoflexales bacterium]
MKGISHFASGLCVASFIPGVPELAAAGGLHIALGGACAMLPDFLDFRFARFLERPDAEIIPDATRPDAQALADDLAANLRAVAETGRPRIVQMHPARRGVIDWALYTVRFDAARGEVSVQLTGNTREARAAAGPLDYTYDGALDISELGGPSFRFSPGPRGVRIEFLPWHRAWTHSLVLALALGVLLAAVFGPLAGLAGGLGYATHVLEDQLGYMGSNLFWPFSRQRAPGLSLLHAADPIPNLVTVWLSLTLLLLNLDRARLAPALEMGPYLAFIVLAPSLTLLAVFARRKLRAALAVAQTEAQRDAIEENAE